MSIRDRLQRKITRITTYSEAELRERLTPEQYHVLQEGGTEAPYSGEYRETDDSGTYHCRVCDAALFSSENKFDPRGAWPAFRAPLDDAVGSRSEWSFGIPRTETVCADCGAHLGHVFRDGPGGTDTRYCINSTSLRLERAGDPVEESPEVSPDEPAYER